MSAAFPAPAQRRALISEVVDGFRALGQSFLESTSPELAADFVEAYGAEPATLWAEVQRELQLRLRSIGPTSTASPGDALSPPERDRYEKRDPL